MGIKMNGLDISLFSCIAFGYGIWLIVLDLNFGVGGNGYSFFIKPDNISRYVFVLGSLLVGFFGKLASVLKFSPLHFLVFIGAGGITYKIAERNLAVDG